MAEYEDAVDNISKLSTGDKKELIVKTVSELPDKDKNDVTNVLIPTQDVTNKIWMTIVFTFAGVFIGSFLAIAVSLFLFKEINDKLITIFTTVSAFLAGLIAPSPMKTKP